MDTAVNNPTTTNPGGLNSFFSFLGQSLGAVASVRLQNYLDETTAASAAKQQALLNSYHAANPSTGPNNPAAAQAAANRTFLEKYLPPSLLYSTDSGGVKTFSPWYYLIVLGLLVGLVLILRRAFRR